MAKKKVLKDGNDYPMLGYRVQPQIQSSVLNDLLDVLKVCNEVRSEEKNLKKNELFVKALRIGLKHLRETKGVDL